MNIDLRFKGLASQPAAPAAEDGQLAVSINLINEYGSLRIPDFPEGDIQIPSDIDKVYMHKMAGFSHYIIHRTSDTDKGWYYSDNNVNPEELIEMTGLDKNIDVNSVVIIGTTICFVTDDSIKYAIWRDGSYHIFDRSAFAYSVSLRHEDVVDNANQTDSNYNCGYTFGNDTQDPNTSAVTGWIVKKNVKETYTAACEENFFLSMFDYTEKDSNTVKGLKGTSLTGARNLFVTADAALNKQMSLKGSTDEPFLKYLSWGVAAVRLYDGSHIMMSDVFTIAPRQMSNRIFLNWMSKRNTVSMMSDMYKVKCYANFKTNLSELSDLVQGIDIFLTPPQCLLNLDNVYSCVTILDKAGTYRSIGDISKNVDQDEYSKIWCVDYDWLTGEKIQELFDSLSFYRSVSFSVDDMKASLKSKYLVNTSDTGEILTLTDMQRYDYGGQCAYAYNSRLHVGNVSKTLITPDECGTYILPDTANISKVTVNNGYPAFANNRLSAIPDGNIDITYNAVVRVTTKENMAKAVHYYAYQLQSGTIDPVISFPDSGASSLTMFIKKTTYDSGTGERTYLYYEFEYNLKASTSKGMAYYIRQYSSVPLWTELTDISATSTEAVFNAANAQVQSSTYTPEGNLIKVSDADNPLLFDPVNSISAGSGKVLSMAAATKALSQGQFGAYPLYIFTDDGIWAASVGTTGAYSAVRPLSRDVVQKEYLSSVTQVDNEVLYASPRGIMMLDGGKVVCLSELLEGVDNTVSRLPKLSDFLLAADFTDFNPADIVPWHEYLQGCQMVHDYYHQRVVVYNSKYDYSYVYSERHRTWGMIQGSFASTIVSYPDTSVIQEFEEDRKVIQEFTSSDEEFIAQALFVTRPMQLKAPDIHKLLSKVFVRGDMNTADIKLALWASNDLRNWLLVSTSDKAYITDVRGAGYKYFVVAGASGAMSSYDSISRMDVETTPKYTDRLR